MGSPLRSQEDFGPSLLIESHGGMGKIVAFTGFAKALRDFVKPGTTIHSRTSWPDVMRGNKDVSRFFDPNELPPYFAEDHEKFEVLAGEPYNRLPYREGDEHIIASWCAMAGIPAPKEIRGYLRILEPEHRQALQVMRTVSKAGRWIAFQPWGGHGNPVQQARSLPVDIAQEIVNKLAEKGYIVIQFSAPHEIQLEKTIRLDPGKDQQGNQQAFEARTLFGIMNLCDGFVGIDSFGQHAWTALGKKNGVVVWGATRPANLGYPTNRNLSAETCPTPGCNRPSILGDMVGGRKPWTCPNGEKCMSAFSPGRIVEELESVNGWSGGAIGPVPPSHPLPSPQPVLALPVNPHVIPPEAGRPDVLTPDQVIPPGPGPK